MSEKSELNVINSAIDKAEKKRRFLINAFYYLFIIVSFYFIIKYFSFILFPPIFGALTAFFLKYIVDFIFIKTKVKKPVLKISLLIFFYLFLGIITLFLGTKLIEGLKILVINILVFYETQLLPLINSDFNNQSGFFFYLFGHNEQIKIFLEEILNYLKNISSELIKQLTTSVLFLARDLISFLPQIALSVFSFVFSSLFFLMDYEKITFFIKEKVSYLNYRKIMIIKSFFKNYLLKMIKGYSILFFITYSILALSLMFLKIDNFLIVAFYIALADILPFVGTGIILIPWSVVSFFSQNNFLAIALIVIFLIIIIAKSFLEPKIIGNQLGLHPLLIFLLCFIGLKLFGIIGLFITPIMTAVIYKYYCNYHSF